MDLKDIGKLVEKFEGSDDSGTDAVGKKEKPVGFWKAARLAYDESFGQSFLDKLNPLNIPKFFKLLVQNYLSEQMSVKEEKAETASKATQDLSKEVFSQPKEAAKNLSDEFSKEFDFEADDEVVVTMSDAISEALGEAGNPGVAVEAIDKIVKLSKTENKPKKPLELKEISELSAVGVWTLAALKRKFKTKGELKNFFDLLQKKSVTSKKLSKLFSYVGNHFYKLIKIDTSQVPELLEMSLSDFAEVPGIEGEAGQRSKAIDIIVAEIFPQSVKKHKNLITDVVLHMVEKKAVTPEDLASLVSVVEYSELKQLGKRLSIKSVQKSALDKHVKQS